MKRSLGALATATILLTLAGSQTPAQETSPAQNQASLATIDRLDPALDALIPQGAEVEKVAGGFVFTEGPLWRPSMGLWFSDVIGDVVRQWSPDGKVIEILHPMGFPPEMRAGRGLIGPNAMVADKDGAVLLCEHANRRIVRITKDMLISVLVDKYQGKRLNSPNDLVYRADGSLYFTDPPYGLPKEDSDPAKELPFNAVFRLANGKLQTVVKDMTRPNGIAFSPDQKTMYVSNSDPARKIWMMYDVAADGTVKKGRVMADATASKDSGNPDGMKLDSQGNIYGAGPGGLWIFSGAGKHLGTIKMPEIVSNCAWGDDGKTLYITARTSVYRIRLSVPGEKVLYQPDSH
ncbi:MAG TPA: SMP-30/gluconolactonase/LRE family protein [Terracidiphilus sp.]|jgi:gluconolactonase